MELLVEKKLPEYRFGESTVSLTRKNERIFDRVYNKNDLLVVNTKTRECLLKIRVKRCWFNINYYVVSGEEMFHFEVISNFRMHYRFVSDKNTYEIFGHKKFTYSIYENGLQIGYFTESSSSTQYKIMYRIECNSDANVALIFAFLLALDQRGNENNDGAAFVYKMSPFWKTKKDFDVNWQPR